MKLKSRIFLCIYSTLTFMLAPAALLWLCRKKRKDPPFGSRVTELLGYYGTEYKSSIWFHTVSVGEVMAAKPVIRTFVNRHPKLTVIVTTTTTTGANEAMKIEGITHVFAPLDSPSAVRRFLKNFKPTHLFIMETELWPCMLNKASAFGTKITVFNARMPEKTCLKYERHAAVVKDLIADRLDMVIAQTTDDALRFERIGVDRKKILISNSLKYDLHPSEKLFGYARSLKKRKWGNTVVLGALSTHDGEEVLLLETFFNLKYNYPDLRLILVPRHPSGVELAAEFLDDCRADYGLRTLKMPDLSDLDEDVLIGNTMGEMEFYMGLCDMVFMGGSLVDVGGHNPLEPAYFSLPVITGPYYYNFAEQYDRLISRRGAFLANDNQRLYTLCEMFFKEPTLFVETGVRAMEVQQEGRGALERTMNYIEMIMTGTDRERELQQSKAKVKVQNYCKGRTRK